MQEWENDACRDPTPIHEDHSDPFAIIPLMFVSGGIVAILVGVGVASLEPAFLVPYTAFVVFALLFSGIRYHRKVNVVVVIVIVLFFMTSMAIAFLTTCEPPRFSP